MNIHKSSEDYLEAMLILQEKNQYIRALDIANLLNVSKPSVSYAVKNLKEGGYIEVADDNEITLTKAGMAIANKMYTRHKVLTDFLIKIGVSPENARQDACKIEHDICDETFEAICKL